MNLQIRDPDVRKKAENLARLRKTTLTDAVREALDFRLKSLPKRPLIDVVDEAHARLMALSNGPGHEMSKAEIDAMWGQ